MVTNSSGGNCVYWTVFDSILSLLFYAKVLVLFKNLLFREEGTFFNKHTYNLLKALKEWEADYRPKIHTAQCTVYYTVPFTVVNNLIYNMYIYYLNSLRVVGGRLPDHNIQFIHSTD